MSRTSFPYVSAKPKIADLEVITSTTSTRLRNGLETGLKINDFK